MSTFHIVNFGCRATQADAAAIERQLLERGCARAEAAGGAEFVVVNTCTVTASADAQARQAIRQVHRENPGARIVVTGCYAQRAPEELARLEGVAWVVGNSHKPEIPGLVEQALLPAPNPQLLQIGNLQPNKAQPRVAVPRILTGDVFALESVLVAPIEGGENAHTRPILKIQDGCNYRCAYCVIPFVRGHNRSLPSEQVVAEIRKLVAKGAKEIVLSGISLGSYGHDLTPRTQLADIVRCILDETALERLRLSSVEPMDVTRDLVELVASTERMARHFHIPLQSGADCVLAKMHRWYRTEHYARRVELIRELLPDAGIGADIIVGFPGETDADHAATLEFVRAMPFTYLHVFSFSARPGTPAASLAEQVPPRVIKQRSKELRALAAEKAAAFRAAQAGKTLRVLTLHSSAEEQIPAGQEASCKNGIWTPGITSNYLNVRVAGAHPANAWMDARISAACDACLEAEVCVPR
jgi:threonylcarbamoyladenosine tRNA methylthiotransferase MtaB